MKKDIDKKIGGLADLTCNVKNSQVENIKALQMKKDIDKKFSGLADLTGNVKNSQVENN